MALSETWLNDTNDVSVVGYRFLAKNRGHGRGGGVGFFIESNLNYSELNYGDVTDFKTLVVALHQKNLPSIIVAVIYRPPSTNVHSFIAEVDQLIQLITKHKNILGDFNIDLLKMSSGSSSADFYNLMASHFLLPAFAKPTKCTNGTSTAIDNIFTNLPLNKCRRRLLIDDLSDHFPIFLTTNIPETEGLTTSSAIE